MNHYKHVCANMKLYFVCFNVGWGSILFQFSCKFSRFCTLRRQWGIHPKTVIVNNAYYTVSVLAFPTVYLLRSDAWNYQLQPKYIADKLCDIITCFDYLIFWLSFALHMSFFVLVWSFKNSYKIHIIYCKIATMSFLQKNLW